MSTKIIGDDCITAWFEETTPGHLCALECLKSPLSLILRTRSVLRQAAPEVLLSAASNLCRHLAGSRLFPVYLSALQTVVKTSVFRIGWLRF